jgi:hypothetical protein
MITVRFDYTPQPGNAGANRTVARYEMSDLPPVGEMVNIKGYPFIVTRRAWAIGDGKDVQNELVEYEEEGHLYAYVDIVKARPFAFTGEDASWDIDPLTGEPYETSVPNVLAPSWSDPVVVVALLRELAENEEAHYCDRDRALIRRGADDLERRIEPDEFGSVHHDWLA